MQLFSRKQGSGRPLVVLHGLFGISDNWAALAKRWADDFTVYTLDLRNHGQSPQSDEWSYSAMADDVIEFFGTERLHDVVLLGHSMGGKTAMRLALDYPMAISKLIVADIAPRRYPVGQQDVVAALLAVELPALESRKDAEVVLRSHLHDEGTIQFLLKNLYWRDLPDGTKQLAWRFNLPVISQNLHIVAEPTDTPAPCEIETLFIRGAKSNYVTADDVNSIPQIFPHSQLITIADAGHWVHANQPDAFYEAVRNFAL
ncbi:MAG: alpha/beta fold hydrolase [Bacteroidia bacterium]|jgi:pimeloyl-ACP methyl ester carboxylesterase|nr:alpha/beta fold hydrolase [Bacteroidia bacterium]